MSDTWHGSSVMAVRPITPSPFRNRGHYFDLCSAEGCAILLIGF
jgi:hypothetical protein